MRISDKAIEIELDKRYPENSYNGYMKQGFYDGFKAALSAEPAQGEQWQPIETAPTRLLF